MRGEQTTKEDTGHDPFGHCETAEELGLGTCWIGWFDERGVKSVLNIPKDKRVDMLVALGYYEQEKVDREHKREAFDKIASFNSY